MNTIRYASIINALIMLQLGATEVTREQQTVFPHNPHLVQSAGDNDPETKEMFINCMKKASTATRIVSLICGAATIGCLGMLIKSESTGVRIGSLALSAFLGAATFFMYIISNAQAAMAEKKEFVEIAEPTDGISADTEKSAQPQLLDIADGVYIFSNTKHCPPCKLLHAALTKIKEALPNLEFFEYESTSAEAQALIQRMGITILSVPLTVVITDGEITNIIVGYANAKDFIQKLNIELA